MTELAKRVWNMLDKEVPLDRQMIADMAGTDERSVRRAIKELRDNGFNVASSSHAGGYWKGNDQDRRRTVSELRARAYKELETARRLEQGPDFQIRMEMGYES